MADWSYLDWPFFEDRHRKLAQNSTIGADRRSGRIMGIRWMPPTRLVAKEFNCWRKEDGYDGVFPGNLEGNTNHLTSVPSA